MKSFFPWHGRRKLNLGIHTPSEVRDVLERARDYDQAVCRSLAIRYFAGLRAAEVERLSERDIRSDVVIVRAENSKTGQRREIEISPNLSSWLDLGGRVPCQLARMREFLVALGSRWTRNVPRHSFVSYHLAFFDDPKATASAAGHSTRILFKYYYQAVTESAAAEFWSIVPS